MSVAQAKILPRLSPIDLEWNEMAQFSHFCLKEPNEAGLGLLVAFYYSLPVLSLGAY